MTRTYNQPYGFCLLEHTTHKYVILLLLSMHIWLKFLLIALVRSERLERVREGEKEKNQITHWTNEHASTL